jgi:ribosomal protein S18 acetylase RimI-like enzyme
VKSGPEQSKPAAGYPPRDFKFLAMDLVVRLMPTGWKFWGNRILLKTSIGDRGPISVPEPYKWSWAGPEEIAFLDRHPEATSPTAYARRAARGDRCLCIKQGTEVVGYQWVTRGAGCLLCGFGPKMEIKVFPLKPGQAYAYDVYTYRKYRGRGIGTMLKTLLFQVLREEGINEVLALVSPTNHVALRLQMRLGAQPQRMVYSYRIRSWSKTFLGPEGDRPLTEWMQQFKPGLAPGLSGTSLARRNQA